MRLVFICFFQALYKALQVSLPRYKSLQSLRLFVSQDSSVHDYRDHLHFKQSRNGNNSVSDYNGQADDEQQQEDISSSDLMTPSGVEQILIDSWLKLCPSLEVVTLFSGSQWRKELDDRQELWSGI
jgi:hypothetical protein